MLVIWSVIQSFCGYPSTLLCPLNQNIFVSPYLEPRTFKLYEELEAAEHGVGDAMISLGLDDANDQTFTTWNASIFGGPGMGKFENRFFQMHITCGDNYPV